MLCVVSCHTHHGCGPYACTVAALLLIPLSCCCSCFRCDKYRFFKYIRQCYLWQRSAHELNGYYHNVWKTRSTPEADEFLSMREAHATDQEYWRFE